MMPLSSRRARHRPLPTAARLVPRAVASADRRALFLQRYARLLASARGLLGDRRDQAQDLVHDAFVQFVLSQRPLDTIDDLDAYLYGMLRKLQLVRLRRAARHPLLSLADYDSLLVGLHVLDGSAYIHALHDLARIGHYACVRKESSSAASIFVLRFFWGCSPPVVARLAHASPVVVAQRLRRARIEARVAIDAPQRLVFLQARDGDAIAPPPPFAIDPTASIDEAHEHVLDAIVRSRRGACLSADDVATLYVGAEPLPTTTLAHLVSCPDCLDRAARHLGIDDKGGPAIGTRTRSSRERDELLPPPPKPTAPPRGPKRDTPEQWLEAVSDHRPRELHVFANGFLVGSHRIGAPTSELAVSAHVDEPLSCVEILSEQGVLLLFLDVDPPFDGLADQHAGITFDDGRTLGASLDFSSSWPLVHIHYEDPGWIPRPGRVTAASPAIADATTLAADSAVTQTSTRTATRRSRWRRILDALGRLLPPVGARGFAWRVAVAVFVAWLAFGGGVPAIAAAAERLWQWVSTLTIGGERPPAPPRSPARPSAAVPPPPPIETSTTIPTGTPVPAPSVAVHLPVLTEPELIDLQVQVLARLDEVDGLLGESIEVAREKGGLQVSILVGRDDRARVLRRALAPLAGRRGLVMRVRTADRIGLPPRSTSSRATFRHYTVEGSRSAMQDDLRAHVTQTIDTRSADTIERAMQDTARTIVETSHRALRHAWALQRLVDPFAADALTRAPAETQTLWRRLVNGHLAAYARELDTLTNALTFAAPSTVASAAATEAERAANVAASMHVEGRRLLTLAADVDRAVQTSFRASTPGATAMASAPGAAVVKTVTFWRDLAEARRLAAQLADR